MKVNYLGPCLAVDHPALDELVPERFPVSCYLVELSDEAGIEGALIEGDVLVVDEARPVQHDDLVVVQSEEALRLCRSHRIGGAFRLMSLAGPRESFFARQSDCRGVVVQQVRRSIMSGHSAGSHCWVDQ